MPDFAAPENVLKSCTFASAVAQGALKTPNTWMSSGALKYCNSLQRPRS